jgi:hypothetical protein
MTSVVATYAWEAVVWVSAAQYTQVLLLRLPRRMVSMSCADAGMSQGLVFKTPLAQDAWHKLTTANTFAVL